MNCPRSAGKKGDSPGALHSERAVRLEPEGRLNVAQHGAKRNAGVSFGLEPEGRLNVAQHGAKPNAG